MFRRTSARESSSSRPAPPTSFLGRQVFPTHSFPFRFFTTVRGIIFVNTYRIHICTNAQPEDECFKVHLNDLFYDLMHNKISTACPTPLPGRQRECKLELKPCAWRPVSTPTPSAPLFYSIGGQSPARRSPRHLQARHHVTVPISSIEGWMGYTRQKCGYCNLLSGYCCGVCSSVTKLVVVHRKKTHVHGSNPPRYVACACFGAHRVAPGEARAFLATGKSGRRRPSTSARLSNHDRARRIAYFPGW